MSPPRRGIVNGFANGDDGDFYTEEIGIIADALQEALAEDYDGFIHIAAAILPKWNVDGLGLRAGQNKSRRSNSRWRRHHPGH